MPPSLKPGAKPGSLQPAGKAPSLRPSAASLEPGAKPASPRPRARASILLIDDDHELMDRTATYLRSKGFLVTISENVFGIAGTIGSERPDAIVLDVRMPALGGDKIASVLSRMCSVPIVFYSAIDDEEGEALAEGHQNASFVSKGTGLRALWARLVEITGSSTSAVGL